MAFNVRWQLAFWQEFLLSQRQDEPMPCLPFVAIDVETANLNNANICQLGVALFEHDALINVESYLVNPECTFNPRFRTIHGITKSTVKDAPTWDWLYNHHGMFSERTLDEVIVVSHTYFDREAIIKACERYSLRPPAPQFWLDTCAIARRVWPEMANHKLPTLAACFDIKYRAHDAGEDARCAGEILIRAVRDSGRTMVQLMEEQLGTAMHKTVTIELKDTEAESSDTPDRATSRPDLALSSDEILDRRLGWPPQPVEDTAPETSIAAPPGKVLPIVHPSPTPCTPSQSTPPVSIVSWWIWALVSVMLLVIFLYWGFR